MRNISEKCKICAFVDFDEDTLDNKTLFDGSILRLCKVWLWFGSIKVEMALILTAKEYLVVFAYG